MNFYIEIVSIIVSLFFLSFIAGQAQNVDPEKADFFSPNIESLQGAL